jgi:hypothetical protein
VRYQSTCGELEFVANVEIAHSEHSHARGFCTPTLPSRASEDGLGKEAVGENDYIVGKRNVALQLRIGSTEFVHS